MVLPTLRQTASRAIFLRPHARSLATMRKEIQEEALAALEREPSVVAQKKTPTRPGFPPQPTAKDLETMHHYIPPAQAPLLEFLTNKLMRHGKHAKAAKTTSMMLMHIHALTRTPPLQIVEKAIEIASPVVRCRKMKRGGSKVILVPQALSERQRAWQGIDFIITEAEIKGRQGNTLAERMARVMVDVVRGHKGIMDQKEKMHREAMVSRGNLPRTFVR